MSTSCLQLLGFHIFFLLLVVNTFCYKICFSTFCFQKVEAAKVYNLPEKRASAQWNTPFHDTFGRDLKH